MEISWNVEQNWPEQHFLYSYADAAPAIQPPGDDIVGVITINEYGGKFTARLQNIKIAHQSLPVRMSKWMVVR